MYLRSSRAPTTGREPPPPQTLALRPCLAHLGEGTTAVAFERAASGDLRLTGPRLAACPVEGVELLVVDGEYRCIGLITVKDIEKAVTYPNATKDAAGRLRYLEFVSRTLFPLGAALISRECRDLVIDGVRLVSEYQGNGRSIDAVSRKMTNTLRVTVALPTTLAMRHP